MKDIKKMKKRPAVILDVDETVLDNSPYEVKLIQENKNYPWGWDNWCRLAVAKPIPGVEKFLKYIDSKGIAIFYVTNRKSHLFHCTLENLKNEGLPQATEKNLMVRTSSSSKQPRRDKVSKDHEILLLIGDNLNDFSDLFHKKDFEERRKNADKLREEFGKRFIILPNPMYGDWEPYSMSEEERLEYLENVEGKI